MNADDDLLVGKPTKPVRVSSPSRLHFGLLRFRADQPGERSFGGLGMMISDPRVAVEVELSESWSAEGSHAERALEYAKMTSTHLGVHDCFAIRVLEAPAQHVGLGLGTQLAFSTSAAVHQAGGVADPAADALAEITGRGNRSAVGAYGFERGGLLLENGFIDQSELGEFVERVQIPEDWRVVLITLPTSVSVHGVAEQRAFEKVPRVAEATTARLWELATNEIMPAAKASEFDEFSEGVYAYGRSAGECFSDVQGGAYATRELALAVDKLRSLGVKGVGQSSWGPTLFAFAECRAAAGEIVEKIEALPEFTGAAIRVTEADNRGRKLGCG